MRLNNTSTGTGLAASASLMAGMGLIEVMITILIVGLALLGLSRIMMDSTQTASQSKARAEATIIAEQQLEALRYFPTYTAYNTHVVSTNAPAITGTNAIFTPSWTVTNSAAPLYREVAVQVSWTDKDGSQSVNLMGRIAQEEPVEAGKKLVILAAGPQAGFNIDLGGD